MGTARPVALGKACFWENLDVPGQRMVMPEGLGESRPMPLPRVGPPEDSVAGYYAETPWRLRSPAVPAPPASRPQDLNQLPRIKDSVSRQR